MARSCAAWDDNNKDNVCTPNIPAGIKCPPPSRTTSPITWFGTILNNVEDIVTKSLREVHIARMRPYADASLNVTAELKEVFNNLKSQVEFDMKRIGAVDLAADSEEYVVKVKWVKLDEEETTWESVSTIYAGGPKYLVAQLRKLRLTKEVHDDLKINDGMKF